MPFSSRKEEEAKAELKISKGAKALKMKKHRLEKLFLSIVMTHADAENIEVLEEKNDIDMNLERILKLITAEDTGTNSSETSSDRSELVSLISEFHQRYQALYGRYDHLIGKLKKHVPHRIGENDSSKYEYSSSDAESSDSGSEDSSNKGERVDNALENKTELESSLHEAEKLQEEYRTETEHMRVELLKLKIENSSLKQQSVKTVQEVASLNKQLITINKEKEEFRSENSTLSSKIWETEKALGDVRDEANNELKLITDVYSSEKAELLSMNENLRHRLEVAEHQAIELFQQLETADEEKISLKSENVKLRTDNSQMKSKINDLSLQLEENDIRLADLKKAIVSAEEQNSILASEREDNVKTLENKLEQLRDENSKLWKNQEDLKNQNSDVGRRLEETQGEVLALQQKLEEVQKEASGSIQAAIIEENNMQMDLDMLRSQKSELEEQLKILTDRLLESQILTKGMEDKLTSKILDQAAMLKDQENSFNELLTTYKKLEYEFQESCKKLELAERLIVEIVVKEETIKILEAIVEEQKEGLNKLEGSKKEFQEKLKVSELEKADVEKEASKLLGQVHTLEVQLVLSNQKLKVTETEAKATVETCKKMAEELRDERKELEDQIMMLSRKLGRSEYELKKMKETARLGMASLTDNLHELAELFEEKHGHLLKRLSESTQELNLVKTWFFKQLNEKKELKNAKDELSVRLNQTEGFLSRSEYELKKMKETARLGMASLTDNLHELAELFEEKHGHLLKRLSESTQELNLVKTWFFKQLNEKKELKNAKDELSVRLNQTEGFLSRSEYELKKMKETARLGMASLTYNLHELAELFEEKHGHLLKRLSESTQELNLVKTWFFKQLNEKKELKNAKDELSVRLNQTEGFLSMLKDEAGIQGDRMAEKEKQVAELMRTVVELENKLKQVEKKVKEDEEVVLAKDEEKREAIRQLCLLIEYHRENCNRLHKYFTQATKRSGQ